MNNKCKQRRIVVLNTGHLVVIYNQSFNFVSMVSDDDVMLTLHEDGRMGIERKVIVDASIINLSEKGRVE